MQIKIKIQPKKRYVTSFTSNRMYVPVRSTKKELIGDLVRSFRVSWTNYAESAYCNGGSYGDYETVRAFHLEKRRKKVEIKKTKKGTVRTVVSPAHWVATYYDIPVYVLQVAGLKVVQGERNFKLVQTKRS